MGASTWYSTSYIQHLSFNISWRVNHTLAMVCMIVQRRTMESSQADGTSERLSFKRG